VVPGTTYSFRGEWKSLINLASFLDSTDLRPEARKIDIETLCREAVKYSMAAVCVQPARLASARPILMGSPVHLCTVIGFPLGADGQESKSYAAAKALEYGADELDMVINIGAIKDNDFAAVIREIEAVLVLKQQRDFLLKLIVETALLNELELARITEYISQTEADYIKTSTGFSSRGVSLEDIQIINRYKSDALMIKAAGGIRDINFAMELLQAGVNRLGSSSAGKLLEEYARITKL
jgi:deoxyribose-phosphate aldolase